MKLRKLLSWLLILVLLSADVCAVAEALNLPGALEVIHAEAFEGTSAVKKAIVSDGTKRVESRAFADSGVKEVYLPDSIEFIADDAFDGCDDLTVFVPRGSYAHEQLHDGDVRYSIIEPETESDEVYAIHSVEYVEETDESGAADNGFLVTVDTTDACEVHVSLLDETSSDVLLTFGGSVQAGLNRAQVKAGRDGEFTLPEYYVLQAKLIGPDGALLCSYTSHKYTARHAAIENKTAADYSGTVVTFGDAGYGVLEEGVVQLEGVQSGNGYIVAGEGIGVGDVLLVKVDGKNKAVKVKFFTYNGDGSITVQPDENIQMGDVYQRLDIDGYMQPVGGAAPAYTDESDITVIPINPSFKTGPLSMEGTIKFSIKMKFIYDKKEDYFSAECWAGHSGSIEVSLTGSFNSRDLEKRLAPTFFDKGVEIPGTDIEAKLTVSLPLDVDFSAGGSAHVSYESKSGFTYNSDDKIFEKIKEDSSEAYAKAEGKITITAGPEIMLRAQLMDWLEAKIRGQIGLEAVGEVKGLQYGGSVSTAGKPDEIHACGGCLDCDVNLIAGIWGSLECTALKKVEIKFLDDELFVVRGKIGDAFYSFINDVESPYGGKPEFGFGFVGTGEGDCRNVKYRADITTVDYKGNTVKKIPVTSTGVYGTVQKADSPCTMYLYPGSNDFAAQFKYSPASVKKTMPKKAAALAIEEPVVNIVANVIDEETEKPISGAKLVLTVPDGTTKTGVTGTAGTFNFNKLPAGEFSLKATAQDYEDESILKIKYSGGQNVNMKVPMTPIKYSTITGKVTDKASGAGIAGATVTLTMPDGSKKTMETGAEGQYEFDKLHAGNYSISFFKEGFETVNEKNQPLGHDTTLVVNARLIRHVVPISARLAAKMDLASTSPVAAVNAEDGSDIDQDIYLVAKKIGGYYQLSEFTLENRTLGTSYRVNTEDYGYCQAVALDAMDMGDGVYTYVLTMYDSNHYEYCLVLKDTKNGIVPVLDFTYHGATDSVYGLDGVNDGFVDYNNAQPSGGNYGIFGAYGDVRKVDGVYKLQITVIEAADEGGWATKWMVITTYELINGNYVMTNQSIGQY